MKKNIFIVALASVFISGCVPEIDAVAPVVQLDGKTPGWTHSQLNQNRPLTYFHYSRGVENFKFDPETSRAIYNKDEYLTEDKIISSKKNFVLLYTSANDLRRDLKFEGLDCNNQCSRRSCAWLASFMTGVDIRMSPKVCATISYVPNSCFPEMKADCVTVTNFTREY